MSKLASIVAVLVLSVPLIAQQVVSPSQIIGVSGNGRYLVTMTGSLTSGNGVKIDANHNFVDSGSPFGTGGGSGAAPYTTTSISASPMSISAATHNQGTLAFAICYDNSSPAVEMFCGANDGSGNLTITYATTLSRVAVFGSTGGAGSGSSSLTVGTTAIASGTTKSLLYDNAGVLGEAATGNNGVWITNGSGVTSNSATLPSGLTIPAPLLTSTLSANGLATNGAGLPIPQTSALVAAEWIGTCPAGATSVLGTNGVNQCITTFSNSNLRGTFLGVGLPNVSAQQQYIPFGQSFATQAACAGASSQFFLMPASGFIRNISANISGTNATGPISINTVPNCVLGVTTNTTPNSLMVPPGAGAGGFVNSWAINPSNFQHVNQYESMAMALVPTSGTPASVLSSIGAEFISDDGTADSILGIGDSLALTASSTQFFGFDHLASATEANIEIPIPIAGTLKNLTLSVGGSSPTNNVVVTLNKNTVNTAITVTAAGGDPANSKYVDVTHTVSVVAGDYIDLQTVSGASTQTTFKAASLVFVPGDSVSAILHGSFNGGTVTTTAKYAQPFGDQTSTTEANSEYTFPMACSVSHLYVYQIAANGGGVTTTFTVFKNNASTAVTGTITSGSGTGSIAVDATHSVSFAQGDRFSLQYVTGSGTSGTMSGWAAQCN